MKYKVGEVVRLSELGEILYIQQSGGGKGRVVRVDSDGWYMVSWENGKENSYEEKDLVLVSSEKSIMENIKEKFALAFKSEPEKTFRKAGITNGDDLLTEDGQAIFLAYLLKQNGAAFKKEVVDPMLDVKSEE